LNALKVRKIKVQLHKKGLKTWSPITKRDHPCRKYSANLLLPLWGNDSDYRLGNLLRRRHFQPKKCKSSYYRYFPLSIVISLYHGHGDRPAIMRARLRCSDLPQWAKLNRAGSRKLGFFP